MQSGICGHLENELSTFSLDGVTAPVNQNGGDCT